MENTRSPIEEICAAPMGLGCMRLCSLPDEKAVRQLVAVTWLLRHPAGITPIVGTVNAERLKGIAAAAGVRLSREDWYRLYLAAGKELP